MSPAVCAVAGWMTIGLVIVLGLILAIMPAYMTFGGPNVDSFMKIRGKRRMLDLRRVFTPGSGGPDAEPHRRILIALLATTLASVALAALVGFGLQPALCEGEP